MFGEHIEEMGRLMEGGVTEANVRDLAYSVADIAFAQGLLTSENDEGEATIDQIEDQARYLFNLEVRS